MDDPMTSESLLALVIAFAVSCIACGTLSRYRGTWSMLDLPNQRSLHTDATPRSGGLGLAMGLVAGCLTAGDRLIQPGYQWFIIALLLTFVVSFADDVWQLSPLQRLPAHFLAAALLVFGGGYVLSGSGISGIPWYLPTWLWGAATVLFVVWMINLYNFMDGMDGFAGGMALIGFGTLGLLGWLAGSPTFTFAALLLSAISGGFLIFNFPPARLFMGDTGSGCLGLLAAVLLLWAQRAGLFSIWIGALLFSPFIVDATWTLIRRICKGDKVWQAHREHFYQRLVQLRWGHRRVVLWAYGLMLCCACGALVIFSSDSIKVTIVITGVLAAVYFAIIAMVNLLERRNHPA